MSDNITLPREVVVQAVKVLSPMAYDTWPRERNEVVEALRAALAAPRPEPVAWMYVNSEGECEQIEYGTEAIDDDSITPLYAAPPAAAPSEDIEALRLDAERYRYLRNRDPVEVMSKEGKDAGCWIDCEEKDDIAYMLQLLTGDDADAAIDAAMQKVPR